MLFQQRYLEKYDLRISDSNGPNTKGLLELLRLCKGKTSRTYRVSSMEALLGLQDEMHISNEISKASKRGTQI